MYIARTGEAAQVSRHNSSPAEIPYLLDMNGDVEEMQDVVDDPCGPDQTLHPKNDLLDLEGSTFELSELVPQQEQPSTILPFGCCHLRHGA